MLNGADEESRLERLIAEEESLRKEGQRQERIHHNLLQQRATMQTGILFCKLMADDTPEKSKYELMKERRARRQKKP